MESSTERTGKVRHIPVPRADTGLLVSPQSAAAHACAWRTVLVWQITEAFDLREEEALWTGYHLEIALEPLLDAVPREVPLAVRQEMLSGTFTQLLERRWRARRTGATVQTSSRVASANRSDWVEVFAGPITAVYSMRPMDEALLRGRIEGVLTELGVGDPVQPRPSTYLPEELRRMAPGHAA